MSQFKATPPAALMTFAVVGGGPTGVELAGMLAEMRDGPISQEFRQIDTRDARVVLVEAGPRILPAFIEKLSQYATKSLNSRRVEVRTGQPVTNCTNDHIEIGSTRLACRTILWAAGVKASPAADWLGVDADRSGRVIVNKFLEVPGHANIFAIGDVASVKDAEGRPVPGVAPAAKQAGAYVAARLKARLCDGAETAEFRYKNQGNLATIGRRAAIVDFGGIAVTGWMAWWLWGVAHILFLIGVRSRAAVAWNWLWVDLKGQRSARLITSLRKRSRTAHSKSLRALAKLQVGQE